MTLPEMSLEINNLCPLQIVTNPRLFYPNSRLYLHCKVEKEVDEVSMQVKMIKQIRAIKKYAKALGIWNLDAAAMLWVNSGCAAKWATQN